MKNKILLVILIFLGTFTVFEGFAQDSFFSNTKDKDSSSEPSALAIGGKINTGSRYFFNYDTFKDVNIKNSDDLKSFLNTISLFPYIETSVNLKYSGENVQAFISLNNGMRK